MYTCMYMYCIYMYVCIQLKIQQGVVSHTIAVDTEWYPFGRQAASNGVDLIQVGIQTGDEIEAHLFHIARMNAPKARKNEKAGNVPPALKVLLEDQTISKVGKSINHVDAKRLALGHNVTMVSTLDLNHIATSMGVTKRNNLSLARLYTLVTDDKLTKNSSVRKCDWRKKLRIGDDKLTYAANDVIASLIIYNGLANLATSAFAKSQARAPVEPSDEEGTMDLTNL